MGCAQGRPQSGPQSRPQCCGVEQLFDSRFVRLERWKHRLLGPPKTTRRLIEALRVLDEPAASALDVGGGLGAIQEAMARHGVDRIEVVDAAPAYLEAARRRAEEGGYVDRVTFRAGDFVELADEVGAADVVTLDRVICCYDDVEALVGRSTEKCRRYYGLVYPRPGGPMRGVRRVANLISSLRGSPYRFYLHEEGLVRGLVRAAGFERCWSDRGWMWHVEVYRRR
ncbi:MAG: class I SAM-dependent methyltransferase [Rhodothermales bacterium]